MVDLRDNVKAADLFTVQITQPQPAVEPKKEENKVVEKMPQQAEKSEAEACG
ncbi:MAG: hypothetical protein MZV70_04545 [Desulfobacterales bacterium]|nr:hypothetical protein [Desulfobacterales bacterium]